MVAESAAKQLKNMQYMCVFGITDSIPAVNTQRHQPHFNSTDTLEKMHFRSWLILCFGENVCVMHSFVPLKTDRKEFSLKRVKENSTIVVHCGNCMHKTMAVSIKQQQGKNTQRLVKHSSIGETWRLCSEEGHAN